MSADPLFPATESGMRPLQTVKCWQKIPFSSCLLSQSWARPCHSQHGVTALK